MKRIVLPFCVALVLLTLGYSLYEARSEDAVSKAPQAVWAECRRLESQIQAADDEIRQLENEARRVQEATANYEFVRKQNAGTLERLRRWADSD